MHQHRIPWGRLPADLKAGRAERDESIQAVLDHAGDAWQRQALGVLGTLRHRQVTGEDIRRACADAGVEPHHPNAWGGFVAGLVKRGTLEATGRCSQMRDPNSHARKTDVYVVTAKYFNELEGTVAMTPEQKTEFITAKAKLEIERAEDRQALKLEHAAVLKAFDGETRKLLSAERKRFEVALKG